MKNFKIKHKNVSQLCYARIEGDATFDARVISVQFTASCQSVSTAVRCHWRTTNVVVRAATFPVLCAVPAGRCRPLPGRAAGQHVRRGGSSVHGCFRGTVPRHRVTATANSVVRGRCCRTGHWTCFQSNRSSACQPW